MKTIPQLQLTRAPRLRGIFLAALAVCFATGLVATLAAQPSLQPLVHPGKWPTLPRGGGEAQDVKVVGHYAYLVMPFDYVDFEVKLSEKPHKFYRVRQP
jgi:hypothetical protein